VVPHFLGEHDHPWLRTLIEEHERFIGRPQRELDGRLREPLPCVSPPRKLRLATRVLMRLRRGHRNATAVPPRRARALVFVEAARSPAPALTVLSTVAASLGVTAGDLQDSLFADLPGERLVGASTQPLSAVELALRTNLALVQALLFHAITVRIDVETIRSGVPTACARLGCDPRAGTDRRGWHADLSGLCPPAPVQPGATVASGDRGLWDTRLCGAEARPI